jgi:hypothetical protein
VVGLAVERSVGEHPIPVDGQGGLGHDRAELGGVVGRAGGHGGPGQEVAVGITGDGELGPGDVLGPRPAGEVPGRVPALQPGGIDRCRRLVRDQPAVGCGRGGAEEEDDELPFFKSRWLA